MASSESKESAASSPGLHTTPEEATKGYFLQQAVFRVKDPKTSLDFYSRVLGTSLLKTIDVPDLKVTLYFLGYKVARITFPEGQGRSLMLEYIFPQSGGVD